MAAGQNLTLFGRPALGDESGIVPHAASGTQRIAALLRSKRQRKPRRRTLNAAPCPI